MKKMISMISVAVLAVVFAAGCGGDDAKGSKASGSHGSSAASYDATAAKTKCEALAAFTTAQDDATKRGAHCKTGETKAGDCVNPHDDTATKCIFFGPTEVAAAKAKCEVAPTGTNKADSCLALSTSTGDCTLVNASDAKCTHKVK
jgi:hypothetical protein